MVKKFYNLRTKDNKPVFLRGNSKIIAFEFNTDSQETEICVEEEDIKFLASNSRGVIQSRQTPP